MREGGLPLRGGEACIDSSHMPLTGEVTVYQPLVGGDWEVLETRGVHGSMGVMGLDLTNADVVLDFGAGSAFVSWVEDEGFSLQRFEATAVGPDFVEIDYQQY